MEHLNNGLRKMEGLLAALDQAQDLVFGVNNPVELVRLGFVEDWKIPRLRDELLREAVDRAIAHVIARDFRRLPVRVVDERAAFLESERPLHELVEWFTERNGPTYRERTWKKMLEHARYAVPRVGGVLSVKQNGARLTLHLYLWNKWPREKEWTNSVSGSFDALAGLEAVIRHAKYPKYFLPPTWPPLRRSLNAVEKAGKISTAWHLCPYVQTFYNERLDLWLESEELAVRVKEILEGNDDAESE